ncbi:N-6 DNA methylase [Pseudogemmobacter sp. W21_MBD1_M6]|uniref:N-6 DNA methylase n=1 Tax=Pseudogemmobacter sp. W21_MBD1_M6 TaxID=3240271 RepID=UPI003F973137
MPLSDIQVRNLKPREKAYKVSDFEGLFVLVKPNGSKLWQFKYRMDGKERLLSIGVYPDVGLAQARKAAPNIRRTNTLTENVMDIQEKDRHDVILANPPFGSGERAEVQQNFPIKSGEMGYLFIQHFIRKLKAGGRAAVVIKNTFLSNGDAAALRRELLETCDLHTVLDCPAKVFQGAGVKTVVLFFEKGRKTHKTWFYALNPERSLGKGSPLRDDELAEFVALQKTRADSPKSWTVQRSDIDATTVDMSVKNPFAPEEAALRSPADIIEDMLARDAETATILEEIRGML